MLRVNRAFAKDDRVRCISITTDPEKDTPQALAKYATGIQASSNWLFLTGPKSTLYPLCVQGFRLPLEDAVGPNEPIIHSERFVLVDQRGMVRAYYDGLKEDEVNQLIVDARSILK
jgi:protein SCO1/2